MSKNLKNQSKNKTPKELSKVSKAKKLTASRNGLFWIKRADMLERYLKNFNDKKNK